MPDLPPREVVTQRENAKARITAFSSYRETAASMDPPLDCDKEETVMKHLVDFVGIQTALLTKRIQKHYVGFTGTVQHLLESDWKRVIDQTDVVVIMRFYKQAHLTVIGAVCAKLKCFNAVV